MSDNPYPYANQKVSDVGEHLRSLFNLGGAPITQKPGAASPSTRQFYSKHQGYDYGTRAGTPIRPAVSGKVLKTYQNSQGWGNRALVGLDNGQSYFLSHLASLPQVGSFKAGDVVGVTGGIPGSYGAGNTTGAHLDITPFSGLLSDIKAGVNSFAKGSSLNQLLSSAKQKYGSNVRAVTRNPNSASIAEYIKKKPGAKLVRL